MQDGNGVSWYFPVGAPKQGRRCALFRQDGRASRFIATVHEKIKRLPSGKKDTVIKRIPRWISVEELITEGMISVKNASLTWETAGAVDIMAIRLIRNVFQEYQVQGAMPDQVFVAY